ncbi:hypothetical protein [uncultured Hyphomicrobium sp.]|uniref:hypothetical protein n=1 Tax=uncultured Hyphomicrobium sp. TaxID=194373 RepID=UPI0025F9C984|nr:hypothetical protein [uncultured Hyphomicrobium sp.]
MRSLQIAKIAAWVHAALVALAVYFVTRVWNITPLEKLPSTDSLVFSASALPPLLALAIGTWLTRGEKSGRLLAGGLIAALVAYAASFVMVLGASQDEPLAPLFLIIASLWIAPGLLVVLVGVWFVGRAERPSMEAKP